MQIAPQVGHAPRQAAEPGHDHRQGNAGEQPWRRAGQCQRRALDGGQQGVAGRGQGLDADEVAEEQQRRAGRDGEQIRDRFVYRAAATLPIRKLPPTSTPQCSQVASSSPRKNSTSMPAMAPRAVSRRPGRSAGDGCGPRAGCVPGRGVQSGAAWSSSSSGSHGGSAWARASSPAAHAFRLARYPSGGPVRCGPVARDGWCQGWDTLRSLPVPAVPATVSRPRYLAATRVRADRHARRATVWRGRPGRVRGAGAGAVPRGGDARPGDGPAPAGPRSGRAQNSGPSARSVGRRKRSSRRPLNQTSSQQRLPAVGLTSATGIDSRKTAGTRASRRAT